MQTQHSKNAVLKIKVVQIYKKKKKKSVLACFFPFRFSKQKRILCDWPLKAPDILQAELKQAELVVCHFEQNQAKTKFILEVETAWQSDLSRKVCSS